MRRLYNFCLRSISAAIVGISFLSPADVPELQYSQTFFINSTSYTKINVILLFLCKRNMKYLNLPSKKFWNRVGGKYMRTIGISDTLNIRLEILIRHHRNFRLKCFSVSRTTKVIFLDILSFTILCQYFTQNIFMHLATILRKGWMHFSTERDVVELMVCEEIQMKHMMIYIGEDQQRGKKGTGRT